MVDSPVHLLQLIVKHLEKVLFRLLPIFLRKPFSDGLTRALEEVRIGVELVVAGHDGGDAGHRSGDSDPVHV